MGDFPAGEMSGLECGHLFCSECWNGYLRTKILEQGTAVIHCAAHGCDIQVDELTMTYARLCGLWRSLVGTGGADPRGVWRSRLIKDPEVLRKYQYVTAKEFVSVRAWARFAAAPSVC